LLFRRKKSGPPPSQRSDADTSAVAPKFYRIEFDMMLKGSIYNRRKQTVRQFGVTVNGATRLVTSGDVVDAATYEALIAAGAIRPPQDDAGAPNDSQPNAHPEKHQEDEE